MATDQTTADLIRENRSLAARVAELEAALRGLLYSGVLDRERELIARGIGVSIEPGLSIIRAAALLSGKERP